MLRCARLAAETNLWAAIQAALESPPTLGIIRHRMPIARETLLEFPCVFPLKVIGRNVIEFEGEVFSIVQKHVPDAERENITRRLSTGNKYLSLTVTFVADTLMQLDGIYLELNHHELVLFTL